LPRPPPDAPAPTEEDAAEEAAVDPELAAEDGEELTDDEEAATDPEYPPEVLPMLG